MKVGSSLFFIASLFNTISQSGVTSLFENEAEQIQKLFQEETDRFMAEENVFERRKQKESSIRDWLKDINQIGQWWNERLSLATWNYETNITKQSSEQLGNLSEKFDQWTLNQAKAAREYLKDKENFQLDTFRQLKLRAISATPEDANILKRIYTQRDYMATLFASAKVCRNTQCLSFESDLIKIMAESRDADELLWAWRGWRNATGYSIRNNFKSLVELQNIGAKQSGYEDFGHFLREKNYEFSSYIEHLSENLWREMKPLYSQLHAFVRRKLQQFYGPAVFGGCTTTIPAHLLGNMFAQTWSNIYDIVRPFPGTKHPDIDAIFNQQKIDPVKLQKKAEEFYVSLGLDPMPKEFWSKSIFVESSNILMDCHPTAFDFHKTQDFRVKMCMGNVLSSYYWKVVHHEMGHLVYYMAYKDQPDIYRSPANAAVDEAIGDTITMSSMTLDHLYKMNFLKEKPLDQYEIDINLLMYQALEKLPMIAFSYTLERWRWDVYKGVISPDNYTESWVRMRQKLMGVHPSVRRSERDFDPGAKYHVALGIPYIRYFFSAILQYQIHASLCQTAGNTKPLQHCDISNSKEAGKKLLSFMRLGSSLPWPDTLKILTGKLTISTQAIHAYYAPLLKWLEHENSASNVTLWTGEEKESCL